MHGGTALRAARLELGLSQRQLAERAALDKNEIAQVERGANKASSPRMRKALALGLGISLDLVEELLSRSMPAEAVARLSSLRIARARGPEPRREEHVAYAGKNQRGRRTAIVATGAR